MRTFVAGAGGAIGARFVPQLVEHAHQVTGTHSSPGNAERVWELGTEPIALNQPPARVWCRIAGNS